jgi:uncharacterized protein with HEPN domain
VIERDRLYLGHILAAIDDIADFTCGGREAFMPDRKTQSAVIRQLEIIGEAVKRLSQELTQAETAVPWRSIAGARDRLIHGYFSVDVDAVWTMVDQDLPTLRAQVQRITAQSPGDALPPS